MTGPQPQYAPGDPVLVEAVIRTVTTFVSRPHAVDAHGVEVEMLGASGGQGRAVVPAVHLHPAPPAPTPTGWAAVRTGDGITVDCPADNERFFLDSCSDDDLRLTLALREDVAGAIRAVLALRAEEAAAAAHVLSGHRCRNCEGVPVGSCAFNPNRAADDAAERAAAAAPATTDDDRVTLVTDTLVDMACADPDVTARRVLTELDAHRAAGSPS